MSERAALYLRVSTSEGKQTEENQRRELRKFAQEEGYELVGEYVDHESGRKGRNEREAFDQMFEAAENREFDVLVFWSLDRFSREGIRKTIAYLQQLDSLSVGFRSYTEPYLNTDDELVSHILLSVLSYFAEYEAKKISRRTKAGIERAREEGKQIGRPSKFNEHKGEITKMIEEGASKAEMSRQTDLAWSTVDRYVERIETE
ncbi:recombinase family protein [Salinibacter ruber]|uniref:DNA invertase Pin-like site-specific DNA recombinase n=1 Tax=Salinibacter ruber TaxID=146919 RepID=A0A9X2UBS9_9BACT|nr:recombinase family protein [Salinibacter ruber]MCS3953396.1 DNA invertase Pin-like site-specific DNA recombinase [Salinibacter ruber]MCS4191612.1 DNA invertase Pin-like site-specific DNA recombinase [Salinibacter ruber]